MIRFGEMAVLLKCFPDGVRDLHCDIIGAGDGDDRPMEVCMCVFVCLFCSGETCVNVGMFDRLCLSHAGGPC